MALCRCRFLALFLLISMANVHAEPVPSSERARKLIREAEQLYRGDASRATLTMRVETPNYQRTMTMESISQGTKKAFIRLLSPKKDRGIATLKQDKEMWNYFPKINKVIKVPPSMMMGSWMGSDFTNDDLVKETQLVDDYNLQLAEDDTNYVVSLIPKEETVTLWGKIEYTIAKDTLLPVSQVFFDDDGIKIRVMTFREPKLFGQVYLPSVMEMVPLDKEGHKTVVIYEELELNAKDVTDDLFTLRNLKKRFR